MVRVQVTVVLALSAYTSTEALKSSSQVETAQYSLGHKAAVVAHNAIQQQPNYVMKAIKNGMNAMKGLVNAFPLFNCHAHPKLCNAPFNCQNNLLYSTVPAWGAFGMGFKNKSNVQTWCLSPQYDQYAYECLVEKDLVKAGQNQYKNTVAGKYGNATAELDGSYCFIDGHCTNKEVTANTTLKEAEAICDQMYGHKTWTTFGAINNPTSGMISQTMSRVAYYEGAGMNGFKSQTDTLPFVLAACVMGNYHCDVMYCKETYCKKDYYVKKYGHFLKENGHDDGSYVSEFVANSLRAQD